MVQDEGILLNNHSLNLSINTASGQQLRSSAVGDVVVYNEKHPNIVLKGVIGCPTLEYNLLSVSKMVKNGHIVVFDEEGAYVVESKHMPSNLLTTAKKNAFIEGILKNELFEFQLPNQVQISANTTNMSKENFSRWHQRLGHLNYNDMKRLKQKCAGLKLVGIPDECETCIISKSKRKTYPSSENRAKRAGEIIHFDVGVINFVSVQGNKYYLLFVDDFSRYNTIYCIKRKSECESIIKGHLSLVANKFSKAPLIVRSDNAKEFFGGELNEYLFMSGIIHQSSCDYTHEQVGVVERMNATISNSGNCLLLESGFPKSFWDLAYETAAYTRNVCPTSANPGNVTPFELYHDKLPDISNLRVFGEKAFLHTPKELLTKLDPKAEEWHFVGYGQDVGSKGWKILDPKTNRIKIASDVTFLQNVCFPMFSEENKK